LGLNQKRAGQLWTEAQLNLLRTGYKAAGDLNDTRADALAASIGKSVDAIQLKASKLGLTNRNRRPTPEQRKRTGIISKERIARQGHPRGALGMVHTPETIAKLRAASLGHVDKRTPLDKELARVSSNAKKIERYGTAGPTFLLSENAYSRARGGKRADLDDRYFRSMWEANYARYLRWLKEQGQIASWEYEPQTFVFHGVTRGVLTYTPDFRVTENGGSIAYHEVKGWMDPKSKAKLARMAKFYPAERIIVIGPAEYRAVAKWSGMIDGWETIKQ
jgi:hypothetical protein